MYKTVLHWELSLSCCLRHSASQKIRFQQVWKFCGPSLFPMPMFYTNMCVFCDIFYGEIFTRAGINPLLASLNIVPQLWKGRNILLHKSAISFNDLDSLSGYLESFLHCPQQQCFVVTFVFTVKHSELSVCLNLAGGLIIQSYF